MNCPHYKSVFDAPTPEEVAAARESKIRGMARKQYGDEGQVEIDSDAKLSEGDDNGCYVQAWVWVDFSGTEFDKENQNDQY